MSLFDRVIAEAKKPPRAGFFDPPKPAGPTPTPPAPRRILPGTADLYSPEQLARASQQTKLDNTRERAVTFRTRAGFTRTIKVEASTDKQAVARARYAGHVGKDEPAIAIDDKPYRDD